MAFALGDYESIPENENYQFNFEGLPEGTHSIQRKLCAGKAPNMVNNACGNTAESKMTIAVKTGQCWTLLLRKSAETTMPTTPLLWKKRNKLSTARATGAARMKHSQWKGGRGANQNFPLPLLFVKPAVSLHASAGRIWNLDTEYTIIRMNRCYEKTV